MWGAKDKSNNSNDDDDNTSKKEEEETNKEAPCKPYLPPRYIHVFNEECDYIRSDDQSATTETSHITASPSTPPSTPPSTSTTPKNRPLLTLSQYRVAWYEQIILRMCYIPHTVENSSYAACESTGALPSLLDLDCGRVDNTYCHEQKRSASPTEAVVAWGNTWNKYLSKLNKPVYIGRNQPGGLGSCFLHQVYNSSNENNDETTTATSSTRTMNNVMYPSWFISSGSHIVDYLRMKHCSLMSHHVLFPEHMQQQQQSQHNLGDAMAYETLIQDKLNYILLSLRYGNDPAWESVYKEQCVRASVDPNQSSIRRFFSLWAWYQTYSERTLTLYNLTPSRYCVGGGSNNNLALDLFRYNDYRYGDGKEGTSSSDGASLNSSTDSAAVHHQHHPYSSMVSSYGGVGGGDSGSVNVYRAMELADMYYTSLEQKLMMAGGGGGVEDKSTAATYFLGTSVPSYIDALLFSHLAEALCDVYLVLVLAKHPRLMKYFQDLYDQFFGEKYVDSLSKGEGGGDAGGVDVEWIKWNNVSNSLNAFNQIPETDSFRKKGLGIQDGDNSNSMTHAITLMQQLAIHCHELDEAMRDAAALRLKGGMEQSVLAKQHRPIGSTLYRWLLWGSKSSLPKSSITMDDSKTKKNANDDDDGEDKQGDSKEEMWRKHMEQVKRDRRYSDEVWISGVVVTFLVALVFSTSKGKK